MRRPALNLVVDAIAFAGFMFMTASGVLLRFVLPPGSGHRTSIWGLNRHEWGGIHYWTAVALLAALSVHVVLHGKWIVHMVRGQQREGSGIRVALEKRWPPRRFSARSRVSHPQDGGERTTSRRGVGTGVRVFSHHAPAPGRGGARRPARPRKRACAGRDVLLQPCATPGCRRPEGRLEEVRTQWNRRPKGDSRPRAAPRNEPACDDCEGTAMMSRRYDVACSCCFSPRRRWALRTRPVGRCICATVPPARW